MELAHGPGVESHGGRVGTRFTRGLDARDRLVVRRPVTLHREHHRPQCRQFRAGRRLAHLLLRAAEQIHRLAGPVQTEVHVELLGGELLATEQERDAVAEPSLELPGHPVRLHPAPADGGLPDEELPVLPGEEDRRDLRGVITQRDHLGAAVPLDGCCGEGRTQIDAEPVAHTPPLSRPTPPSVRTLVPDHLPHPHLSHGP